MDPAALAHLPPHESRGGRVVATIAVSFSFAILSLVLRLCCRLRVVKTPGWDDLTIVLATVRLPLIIWILVHAYFAEC